MERVILFHVLVLPCPLAAQSDCVTLSKTDRVLKLFARYFLDDDLLLVREGLFAKVDSAAPQLVVSDCAHLPTDHAGGDLGAGRTAERQPGASGRSFGSTRKRMAKPGRVSGGWRASPPR